MIKEGCYTPIPSIAGASLWTDLPRGLHNGLNTTKAAAVLCMMWPENI